MDTPTSVFVVIQPKSDSLLVRLTRRLLSSTSVPKLGDSIKNLRTSWPFIIESGLAAGAVVGVMYIIAGFLESHALWLLGGALVVTLSVLWIVGRYARPSIYAEIAELPNAVRCELYEVKIGRDGNIFLNLKVFSVLPLQVCLPDIEVFGLALNRNDLLVTKSRMEPNKKHVFNGGRAPLVVCVTVHVTVGSWSNFLAAVDGHDIVTVSATIGFGSERCHFVDRAGHVSGIFPETVPGTPSRESLK